ncbi:DUF1990 family protein [Leucobacter sp. cx-169]|nr:DUF1990 family protein [Leucobacter sp. cx-169]MBC9935171.1 DUF1990 family protein [Leucobacter sp. cx-87]
MRFPPEGTTPFEDSVRLGSGQDRFTIASSALMTWGAARGAGLVVEEVVVGDGGAYSGIEFDAQGTPVTPGSAEQNFGPDGEPYITAGTTARLGGGGQEARKIRVVYVVNEPRRIGLAVGSMDDSGAIGESLYCVEFREDDSVWATVRGFLVAPESGLLGIKGRTQLKKAMESARDQLRALLPAAAASAEADATPEAAGQTTAIEDAPSEPAVNDDGDDSGTLDAVN